MPSLPASIWEHPWDVLVVGAGAAGLMAALELPEQLRVLVIAKRSLHSNASRWAQAGIAAVSHADDSLDCHMQDTLRVGAGLCDVPVVQQIIGGVSACIERLVALGIQFDQSHGAFTPTLAGAHRHPRLLHVKDRTGSALMDGLERRIRQKPNCVLIQDLHVLQLWLQDGHCIGVQAVGGQVVGWIRSQAVVLASGGGSHLFAQTTTPSVSTGDGVALAWRAGAALRDMEFVQFHPTALKHRGLPQFLISEAVRGFGAQVLNAAGEDVLTSLPDGALASRDQICRAMDWTMRREHLDCLWLDLRSIGRQRLESEFHTIIGRCRGHGIDPVHEPIPVAPAAHYWIGGIAVGRDAATSVPGLYALGEVASTGFHGANRLAGNSLLECLVQAQQFAHRFQPSALSSAPAPRSAPQPTPLTELDGSQQLDKRERIQALTRELGELCWRCAGIARHGSDLQTCAERIESMGQGGPHLAWLEQVVGLDPGRSIQLVGTHAASSLCGQAEWSNRLQIAQLLVQAALHRVESRGCHFRVDAPHVSAQWRSHTVQQRGQPIHSAPVLN